MTRIVDERFPQLTGWIRHQGWIEIGSDEFSSSFIRVLDPGGMVWEGAAQYPLLDDALHAAEQAITAWMHRQGMDPYPVSGDDPTGG